MVVWPCCNDRLMVMAVVESANRGRRGGPRMVDFGRRRTGPIRFVCLFFFGLLCLGHALGLLRRL